MSDRNGERIGIFGQSGSGKSVLARSIIDQAERVFVFDPKGDWEFEKGFEVLKHFSQIKPFLKDMGETPFRVVYSPEALQAPKRLSTLSLMLLDHQRKYLKGQSSAKLTLVADELSDGFPLGLPAGVTGFAEACQKGRAFGLNIVGIAQRPAQVHPSFRGNLNKIIAFNFSFTNDRKAIAEAMEDEQVKDELTTLHEYEYLFYQRTPTGGKWEKKPPIKM